MVAAGSEVCQGSTSLLHAQTKQFMVIERQNWVCQSGLDIATISTMAAVEREFHAVYFRNGLN